MQGPYRTLKKSKFLVKRKHLLIVPPKSKNYMGNGCPHSVRLEGVFIALPARNARAPVAQKEHILFRVRRLPIRDEELCPEFNARRPIELLKFFLSRGKKHHTQKNVLGCSRNRL